MKHLHHDLIVRAAVDTTPPVWLWSPASECWVQAPLYTLCTLGAGDHCAVGDKPTAPPRRMCALGGKQFPEPMTEAPAPGTLYWVAYADGEPIRITWMHGKGDREWLDARLGHDNEAAALEHSRALRAANLEAVRNAK